MEWLHEQHNREICVAIYYDIDNNMYAVNTKLYSGKN